MKRLLLTCSIWGLWVVAAGAASDPEFGIRLFNDKQWTTAQQFFESFTAKHPTDAVGAFYLGRTLFEQEQYEQAMEWLEKAALLNSGDSYYHLWLGRAYGNSAQRASILWQFPLARKVRIHFEKAVKLDPDNVDARADLAEYYLKAPRILGGGKEKAEAQAHEISYRNLQEGLRVWRMIAAESAQEYVRGRARTTETATGERSDIGEKSFAMNFTHKYIQTNGIRMHVVEAGSGFPVLLCHGFPELWTQQEKLAEVNAVLWEFLREF